MSAELFQRPEICYYRHNGTTVTSRYFTTPSARYFIRDLTFITRSQREAESGVKIGLITAAVELVVILPTLTILNPSVGYALIAPALIVPILVAYAYGRRRPAVLELLAHHRGQEVTLFATSDQQQFGQVARALMRASEATHR